MTTIVYIHGAFSSRGSFNYIANALPAHEMHFIDYEVDEPVSSVVNRVDTLVNSLEGDVTIVSHSLGGIIAISAAKANFKIQKVLTMATPFGGSRTAGFLKFFTNHTLYRSIAPGSELLRSLKDMPHQCDILSIITTVGNNHMMMEPNDGVVTLRSQKALGYGEQHHIAVNHFEVLMSSSALEQIERFVFNGSFQSNTG